VEIQTELIFHREDERSRCVSRLGETPQGRAQDPQVGGDVMGASDVKREKRLRRAAARQGLRLSKSARRDRNANDYGKYRVENPEARDAIVPVARRSTTA
jgi:hypothetical protein